jgi:phenylacetate-CoA ligase
VQYDPRSRFFETHDGTLLFTADGSVPLVRYHIADDGGLVTYPEMLTFCHRHGFDPLAGLEVGREAVALPFVYVFGRSLFTVSYFGANVYPENITAALERPDISAWVTGKFVLDVVSDTDEERHLRVVVELAPGETAEPSREALLADAIVAELRHLNSEFTNYVPTAYQRPLIELRPTGDPTDFPAGVKHRYTRP